MSIYSTFDSATLLGVMRDERSMAPPSSYFLDLLYPDQINFDDEFVDFGKIAGSRKIAPLVVPTAQGKPIYARAERRSRVKPAYVKPKDPVTATRMIKRKAGLGELNSGDSQGLSPQQRYNATVADILREHREAIERRWEQLAADAALYGKVVLEDEAYPRTIVDFGRDPSHDITLGAGARWGDNGVSIMDTIQGWITQMRRAKFGGPAARLTVGADVWDVMRKEDEVRELVNTNYTLNNGVDLNLGLRQGADVEFIGKLSGTLELYVYSDYYEDANGNPVNYMDPRDVLLTGNSVRGVRCFGAIQDIDAQFQPVSIFPKMWREHDPSATFIMSQSAPLMVPVNPNNTLRARVLG